MNHKRLPKFEDCETIERLTGGDYLAVRNLIAYSSTEKGIILKDLSNGESRPVSGGGKGERRPVFSPIPKAAGGYGTPYPPARF